MSIENEWEKYSNGVGRKILAKYGYKGNGLGKFEDGIKEPIKAHKRAIERGGLDYEIPASKKQVTEPRRFSTIDFAKPKDDEDMSTSESDIEKQEPQIISQPELPTNSGSYKIIALPSLPPIPDATLEQIETLESKILSIKNMVQELEVKYCTQPISFPTNFPFTGLTTGQADSLCSQLSSVINILRELSTMSTEELDFEQIAELDSLIINTIPQFYEKLAIDQYILFIVYPYFKNKVITWDFKENKPTDANDKDEIDMCLAYLQMYRDEFNSWKNFTKKKLSFQNHHLWNTISHLIMDKITDFVQDSSFNIQNPNTTKFLIKLLSMWTKVMPSAINIEHKMAEHIANEMKTIELKDIINLHAWISPWVKFFGQETMESVLVSVYSKLDTVLAQNMEHINIKDFSIIQTLLPWKHTLTTYLYQKLLKIYVVPILRSYLREFKIDPTNQELKPLWIVFQWYDLFAGSHTCLDIYIKIFEDEFFERWLNILYTWLSNTKCKYEECVLWYRGWKEFFEENANELYLHIYANFNNAVSLMNTLLCDKKDL